MKYDIFLDESCHLEHDKSKIMCIGSVKVPYNAREKLRSNITVIKNKYNVHKEIKWSKFSKVRLPLYKELVDCFFDNPLDFRCVLIKYKDRLNHEDFNQGSHDNYYYKMMYYLLLPNPPGIECRVFVDIKDTKGRRKLEKIKEVFENKHKGDSPFTHFQQLRSHENEFFQLVDLFIGAISYNARIKSKETGLVENPYKLEFISYLEEKSGFNLDETTPPWETKFNIFNHQPKRRPHGIV